MKKNNNILLIALYISAFTILKADSWMLEINATNIYNNSTPGDWITLGVCDGCDDGFQYGSEDEYDTPDGPIDYTDIQFTNIHWLGTFDSNGVECESAHFASDIKSFHEPSDLLIWNVTGSCADEVQNNSGITQLNWLADSLNQDYEVYIYVGDNGTNMRLTTAVNINCDDLTSTYEFIDGEWIYNANIKVLMGGCASSGLTTFYWDDDDDGLGSDLYSEYCNGYQPDGWVTNSDDLDDTIYCETNNFDSCWVCDGANALMDCNEICSPDTPVGQEQANQGLIYGAFIDDCGVCSEGGTGHEENSDQDCNQDCFGLAYLDDCDICSGGNTEHEENSDQDCAGLCFGDGFYDYCGDCNGYNQSCLDLIFGDGPSDLYAQINLESEQVNLTWIYDDISDQVLGYLIWEYSDDTYNLLSEIESNEILSYEIDEFISGTFCVSVYDVYDNETPKICTEASEFSNYNFIFNDGSGSSLLSFPYLANDDTSIETIFGPIEEHIEGIITEGDAVSNDPFLGWVGGLSEIDRKKGYWIKIYLEDEDETLNLSVSGIPTDPNTVYNLHEHANLISYIGPDGVSVGDALPDNMEDFVVGIIGQGVAASPDPTLGWVGSLDSFWIAKGYWVKIDPDISSVDLIWNLDDSQSSSHKNAQETKKITPFEFKQSTQQSFYFIEEVTASTFILDTDDILVSYCNDIIVGSRYYNGKHTDVPAMGYDGYNTVGYCMDTDTPNFRIYDSETDRMIELFGEQIPSWENLEIYKIALTDLEPEVLPDETEIASVYPNPFNPSTTISFNTNKDSYVELFVYDIHGKLIQKLINGKLEAGMHSVKWNPYNISSGLYILSLNTEATATSSKLLYIK